MQYIEPRDVEIQTSHFVMEGVIEGSPDSFKYQSTNSHFSYHFPSSEIDSLKLNEKELSQAQLEIVEACKNKIHELLANGRMGDATSPFL